MNGRRGPLGRVTNLTTMTMVISNVKARIMRIVDEDWVYIEDIINDLIIGIWCSFLVIIIKLTIAMKINSVLVILDLYSWFGVNATKYEKRTSMPLI